MKSQITNLELKLATQDAWEAAGQLNELVARVQYVTSTNRFIEKLVKLGSLVKASAGYKALMNGDKSFFDHLSAAEVELLFTNVNVRMDLLKGLRINDMTLVNISVEDQIKVNAELDYTTAETYTASLKAVVEYSFSAKGKRAKKNVLEIKETFKNKKVSEDLQSPLNLGAVCGILKLNEKEIRDLGYYCLSSSSKDGFLRSYTAEIREIEKALNTKIEVPEICNELPLLEKEVVEEYSLNAEMVLAVCNLQEYRNVRAALLNRAMVLSKSAAEAGEVNFDSINEDLKSNIVHAVLHFEGLFNFEFNSMVNELEPLFDSIEIAEPAPAVCKEIPLEAPVQTPAVQAAPVQEAVVKEVVVTLEEEVNDVQERIVQDETAQRVAAQLEAAETYELESLPGEDWSLSNDLVDTEDVDGFVLCYRTAVKRSNKLNMISDSKRLYVKDAQYNLYKAAQELKNKQRAQEAMMW